MVASRCHHSVAFQSNSRQCCSLTRCKCCSIMLLCAFGFTGNAKSAEALLMCLVLLLTKDLRFSVRCRACASAPVSVPGSDANWIAMCKSQTDRFCGSILCSESEPWSKQLMSRCLVTQLLIASHGKSLGHCSAWSSLRASSQCIVQQSDGA